MAKLESNLHITFAPCRHDSRLLKETRSLIDGGITERVFIAALHEPGLPEHEALGGRRRVRRIKLRTKGWPRNLAVQLLKYCEFGWKTSRYALRVRAELINVHTLTLLPLGVWLKFRLRAKLIYDTHELETEAFGLAGFRQRLARLLESALIRFADLVVVVAPKIREHYETRYGHPAIVCVLNCPPFRAGRKTDLLRSELGIPGSAAVFLYLGNLCEGRGIDALLEAFDGGPEDRALVLVGYGDLAGAIAARARRCRSVYLRPAVSPNRVVEYAASADFGMCLIEDRALSYRYSLPNKLFEYLMAGLPVIVSNLPQMAALVRDCGVGEVAEETSAAGINAAIARLRRRDGPALRANVRACARRYAWEGQQARLLAAYRAHVVGAEAPATGARRL